MTALVPSPLKQSPLQSDDPQLITFGWIHDHDFLFMDDADPPNLIFCQRSVLRRAPYFATLFDTSVGDAEAKQTMGIRSYETVLPIIQALHGHHIRLPAPGIWALSPDVRVDDLARSKTEQDHQLPLRNCSYYYDFAEFIEMTSIAEMWQFMSPELNRAQMTVLYWNWQRYVAVDIRAIEELYLWYGKRPAISVREGKTEVIWSGASFKQELIEYIMKTRPTNVDLSWTIVRDQVPTIIIKVLDRLCKFNTVGEICLDADLVCHPDFATRLSLTQFQCETIRKAYRLSKPIDKKKINRSPWIVWEKNVHQIYENPHPLTIVVKRLIPFRAYVYCLVGSNEDVGRLCIIKEGKACYQQYQDLIMDTGNVSFHVTEI